MNNNGLGSYTNLAMFDVSLKCHVIFLRNVKAYVSLGNEDVVVVFVYVCFIFFIFLVFKRYTMM